MTIWVLCLKQQNPTYRLSLLCSIGLCIVCGGHSWHESIQRLPCFQIFIISGVSQSINKASSCRQSHLSLVYYTYEKCNTPLASISKTSTSFVYVYPFCVDHRLPQWYGAKPIFIPESIRYKSYPSSSALFSRYWSTKKLQIDVHLTVWELVTISSCVLF